jgi:hypothetical protein
MEKAEVKAACDFANLAERMREAQKEYFQNSGNRFYLMEAKKLEALVDACIKARREREEQPGLVKGCW